MLLLRSTFLLRTSRNLCPSFKNILCVRYLLTSRRHRKRLRIPQLPTTCTLLPKLCNSALRNKQDLGLEPTTHIVFNPPSSAPNVYHTPRCFLPKHDSRISLFERRVLLTPLHPPDCRKITKSKFGDNFFAGFDLHASIGKPFDSPQQASSNTATNEIISNDMLKLKKPLSKAILSPNEIQKVKCLRQSDPSTWTISRLAKKFSCSKFFIGLIAPNPEKHHQHKLLYVEKRRRWSRGRLSARLDRDRRKQLWGRG